MNRPAGSLLAISDLHVAYPENREFVSRLRPESDGDWLLVAGDVGDRINAVAWARAGPGGPVTVVPLFLLYDYTFRPDGVDQATALARAYEAGIVCRDEMVLHPDPYPTREAWCRSRVAATAARLDALDPSAHTVLVNHFPLVEDPTRILRYPVFAQWCGTRSTRDWHVRYRAA